MFLDTRRRPTPALLGALLLSGAACQPADEPDSADLSGTTDTDTDGEPDDTDTDGLPDTAAFEIVLGTITEESLPCAEAWAVPDELLGEDGLAFHGWTLDDLRFTLAWNLANDFINLWISDNSDAQPSVRVRPWLAPQAGVCLRQQLEQGSASSTLALRTASAFARPSLAYDQLAMLIYAPITTAPGLPGDTAIVKALHSLLELDNPLPEAPAGADWTPALEQELLTATQAYPPTYQRAIARLLIALGEAHLLTLEALAAHPAEDWRRIWAQFLLEDYSTLQNTFVNPAGGSILVDMRNMAADFDGERMLVASQRVTKAATQLATLLAEHGPAQGAEPIDLSTPIGRVLINPSQTDDDYDAAALGATALVVDFGGNDSYAGQYASSASAFWLNAGVLIDVAGDDLYGSDRPDISEQGVSPDEAFAVLGGFTQGAGLFGVGVLVDAGGNDDYHASVYSQGAGAFGVGALIDLGGNDLRQLGHFGQGAGYFGLGLLHDLGPGQGDDYGVYSGGQGFGKPEGLGLLLDNSGDDRYVAYYEADEPYLPGPSYPNYYALDATWPYARDGVPHFMSQAQGVGWGYRGDWSGIGSKNWMGGLGALVDLGEGEDVYLADTFSKGMGFVYGFGFLSDGGGDDLYRSFWWGPAAGAHMGVGVLEDRGGNDDYFVTQASGGFGYDYSIAWLLEWGGDDRYGGRLHLGEGYTNGQGYFIDYAGDDTYNPDDPLASLGASAEYGRVRVGAPGSKLIGAFLDLGGGADVYGTDVAEIGDDLVWHLAPVGDGVDPAMHKGVGIDR